MKQLRTDICKDGEREQLNVKESTSFASAACPQWALTSPECYTRNSRL